MQYDPREYAAHAIEGADTFFVETDTTGGVTMRFALSHACAGPSTRSNPCPVTMVWRRSRSLSAGLGESMASARSGMHMMSAISGT